MAEVGARTLSRLIDRVNNPSPLYQVFRDDLDGQPDTLMQSSEILSSDNHMQEYATGGYQLDSTIDNTPYTNINFNWDEMLGDLTGNFELQNIMSHEAVHL